jgi:hypothetical protein
MRWQGVILTIYFLNIMALTDNLQAFYKLSDTSDSSGNNRTLTNNGNVTFAPGKIGNAAVFDGSNYLQANNVTLGGQSEFTVSFWFNNSDTSGQVDLLGQWPGNQDNIFFYVLTPDQDNTRIVTSTVGSEGSDEFSGFAPYDLSNGTWHHTVFTLNSTGGSLYLDGQLLVLGNNTIQSLNATNAPFYIGRVEEAARNQSRMLDALGIWNRALSNAEVAELYNSGNGGEIVDGAWVPALPPPTLVKMQAPVKFFGKVKFGV